MQQSMIVAALAALSLLSGACGSSSSPTAAGPMPTAPSVSTAAVKSLHVTGPAIVVGDTKPFAALATFADGTQQDVAAAASWTSSNTTIATVDARGNVTGLKEGGVSIRATFRTATDSSYLNVTPLLFFKAAGTVSETPPGFAAVANARIEIVAGSNAGTVVTSDADGNFSFGTMRGDDYTLRATRDGFQDLTQKLSLTRDIGNITLLMFPVPPSGATARCKDKSWSFATDKSAACTRNGGVAYWVCPGPFCS